MQVKMMHRTQVRAQDLPTPIIHRSCLADLIFITTKMHVLYVARVALSHGTRIAFFAGYAFAALIARACREILVVRAAPLEGTILKKGN